MEMTFYSTNVVDWLQSVDWLHQIWYSSKSALNRADQTILLSVVVSDARLDCFVVTTYMQVHMHSSSNQSKPATLTSPRGILHSLVAIVVCNVVTN